jgi:uncharacterized repeat protein (TIGR01451 family)
MRPTLAVFTFLMFTSAAYAHVTLQPREAAPGSTVTYTVRVPTEGTVTTTGVEVEIPDGIVVLAVDGPTDTYEMKKSGDRITSITWKTEIAPKQARTFTFSARNPSAPAELSWKAHQHFADGTTYDWVEPAGSKRPAARTKIAASPDKPAAGEHEHHK